MNDYSKAVIKYSNKKIKFYFQKFSIYTLYDILSAEFRVIRNKYITFIVAALIIFFAIKQHDEEVESGKIKGETFKSSISANVEKITEMVQEYRQVGKDSADKENWADEMGVQITPLLQSKNPSIFSEKVGDMIQTFLKTKKGMELFERLLVTPPSSDGSVDILGLGRSPTIPYFNISRHDKKIGTGAPFECGQKVSFRYSSKLQGKKEIHSIEEKTETARIGQFKYIPGLEYNLIGMRAGGERDVIIPPSQAYGLGSKFFDDSLAAKFVFAHIEAVKDLSKEPDYSDFNLSSENATGQDLLLCGDMVSIEYQIFNDEMRPLSPKMTKSLTIGGADLPIGVNKGVEGISRNEERRVDMPFALRKTFDGENSGFFSNIPNLPKNIVMKIYKAKKLPMYE